jgi:cytochrome c oxidase subunit I+III
VTREQTEWQRALGQPDRRWRETVGTSVVDAEPQEIIHLPGPSQLPLFLAGGLLLALVGALTDLVTLFILGLVVGVVATWLWLWPDRQELEETPGPGDAGLPVAGETSGTRSTLCWGMALFLLVLADVLLLLGFSYYYLRVNVVTWPPAGIGPPHLLIPSVILGLTLLTAAANYWGYRIIRGGNELRLPPALVAALLLGLVFVVLQGLEFTRHDFTHQASAYGSAFFTLAMFQAVLVLVGLGMTAMMLARTLAGHFGPRRFLALQNVSFYWGFVALSGAIVYAILYLSPYLV